MFCPNCRNNITNGADFCPHCGTNLKQILKSTTESITQHSYSQFNTQQFMNNQNINKKKFPIVPIIIIAFLVIACFAGSKIMKKDTANDNEIQDTIISNDNAFLMSVEDIFTITGKGTVVSGEIERGTVRVNDEVQIIGLNKENKTVVVTSIEKFRKEMEYAEAGQSVGLLLEGIEREDVERGQVIAAPNSIKAHKKFIAKVTMLSEDEGGRSEPITAVYRPQFYFRTTDVTGVVNLPKGTDKVMPGESVEITVELISSMAMEKGTTFLMREGGRTVGTGTVTKIIK